MPSLRSDRTGQMSIIELLKLIYQIYSITKTPLKKFAKWLKTNFVVIPLWTGKIEYLYHIHEDEKDESKDERKKMYDYLKDADALKDFGFVFGNELNYNGARDIGVYGFLPFFEINHYYGNARIPKKKIEEICILLKGGVEPSHFRGGTIADICNVFEKNIYPENPSKKNIYCAIAAAKLLLKFVFEECTKKSSKDFKRMLSNPEGVFAHVYERLYESAPNVGEMRNKWMSRFLKASLRGMYASSEGLVVYRFTTKPLEAAAQVKDIAERMDGDASRAVDELAKIGFIQEIKKRLVVAFGPRTPKEAVQSLFHGRPSKTFIVTDKPHFDKLNGLFEVFRDEMYNFDRDIIETFRQKMDTHYRIPIIINVFRAPRELRSVCAAYNKDSKRKIQQIKFPEEEKEKFIFGSPLGRCAYIIDKYRIRVPRNLQSEAMKR